MTSSGLIRQFKRLLFLLTAAIISVPAQPSFRSDSVRISSSAGSGSLSALRDSTATILSVNAVARHYTAAVFENIPLRKLEVKFPSTTLKFSAGNSFVVVTETAAKRSRVIQLADPIMYLRGEYFGRREDVEMLLRSTVDPTVVFSPDTAAVGPKVSTVPTVLGYSVEEKKNGTLLRIHLSGKVKEFNRTLQIGEWIYVTLPEARCDTVKFDTTFPAGIVRRIKPIQYETSVQLSLQLRGKIAQSEIVQDQLSDDVLLTLIPPAEVAAAPKVDSAAIRRAEAERARQQTASSIERQKKKWKLDVVVIDPGHGGHDPGTIGIIGTREKDITLGVSLKLGELIQKEMPDVKVVYTRKTDRFVELYRRGQIANENEGKIFISIHCNSTERKPSSANGFEIYLLRPGKTEDAIRIAEKENAVVKLEKDFEDRYQELTEENFIILTMAQSAYVKQSERFAELLEETMSAQMEGKREAVKQAGFYVLVGASMPNVLIETGYLSNVKDERFLRSPAGQKKIATAILNALKAYKNEYEDENQ